MKQQYYFLLLFWFSTKLIFAQTAIPTVITPAAKQSMGNLLRNAPLQSQQVKMRIMRPENEGIERDNLLDNPDAKPVSIYPQPPNAPSVQNQVQIQSFAQTLGLSFNGVTGPDETGAFPPDNMGAVGPTQYVLFVNGKLRSFNKATGAADGVLEINPDAFFSSVMTPAGVGEVAFTSDPRVRYDRFSGKWILVIIDVVLNTTTYVTKTNKCLIAYSDSGTLTAGTTWTFYTFTSPDNNFIDYPTLGIDVNALYIGGNMFTLAGSFVGTNGFVINRSTLLTGGAVTVYSFLNLCTETTAGPYTPQGVDNFDTSPTEGYFVGVDILTFSKIMFRRVSTPAEVPTISANIAVTVPTTTSPTSIPHSGNTGGTSGRLDAIDDRLFAAVIRNGHLWTAHNIRVSATGVASTTSSTARNGTRWYDFTDLTTTPTLYQAGTIFDNTATLANSQWYSIPTVMVSGQGHAAFSMTTSGTNNFINVATTGRLSGDVLGTTQPITLTTSSSTAYNPPGDPGPPRRWGDYSYVSLDPLDDMTMWLVNQYCVGTNQYGCNITKLIAPPPATPTSCSPASVAVGQASVNITLTGTAVSGSGFYDPGANLPPPALAFSHITGAISGGVTVNSVTYNSPTSVTLNISTMGASAGLKNVTITNPDGQSLAGTGILEVTCTPIVASAGITSAGTICVGGTITLTSSGGGTGGTYTWAGPAGSSYSSNSQNPSSFTATSISFGGVYTVSVSATTGCSATATTSVLVNASPAASAGITSAGTICVGGTITLTSSGGSTYTWTGPAGSGYSSNSQNPSSFTATSISFSGVYTISVSATTGCTATATTSVLVNALPVAVAGKTSVGTICVGGTITLTSSGGSTYTWTGPAGSGYSSNSQNPSSFMVTSTSFSGIYTVSVSATTGCTATATTSVSVNTMPIAAAAGITSAGTICVGGTITLTSLGGGTGGTYTWAGPAGSGYSSNSQNPTGFTATSTSFSGVYTVSVSATTGCTATATTSVSVNALSVVNLSYAPICLVGNPLSLSASGGVSYSWKGPNGFSSTNASPASKKSQAADAGIYSVTVTNAGNCTASATIEVYFGAGIISASSNSPVCKGSSINLSASATHGVSYKWTKLGSTKVWLGANISIPNAKTTNAGLYTVWVTGDNGCISKEEVLISVTPCPGTRLASEANEEIGMELNAYPNPVTNTLTVEVTLKEPSKVSLQLFNSLGQKSGTWQLNEEATIHKTELNLSKLMGGTYLLQAQAGKQKVVKKVVKEQN